MSRYFDWLGREADKANYENWKERLERFAPAHAMPERREKVKYDLTIKSWSGGENTEIEGTIDGHAVTVVGSASDRGTDAEIDGISEWWSGTYENDLELELESIFEDARNAVAAELGEDAAEDTWCVRITDGYVLSVDRLDT